jgi:hypothetical protein
MEEIGGVHISHGEIRKAYKTLLGKLVWKKPVRKNIITDIKRNLKYRLDSTCTK